MQLSRLLTVLEYKSEGLDTITDGEAKIKRLEKTAASLQSQLLKADGALAKGQLQTNLDRVNREIVNAKRSSGALTDALSLAARTKMTDLTAQIAAVKSQLISADGSLDKGALKSDLAALRSQLKAVKSEAASAGVSIGKIKLPARGARAPVKAASAAGDSSSAFSGAFAGAVTFEAAQAIGQQALQLAANMGATIAEFERYQAVLRNTLQSNSAMRESMAMLASYAANTPYQLSEVVGAYTKLTNAGLRPSRDEMVKLGDIAAFTGKNLDDLAEASKDAVTGEFERLKEFGIRASKSGDEVTFSFRGVTKTVKNTNEAIQGAIISFGELAGVQGAMASQTATLGGMISNFYDSIDALVVQLGENGLNSALKFVVGTMTELINTTKLMLEQPVVDRLRQEQSEVAALGTAIASQNTSSGARNLLVAQMQAKYPEWVKYLRLESATNQEIAAGLVKVNNAYIAKIAIATQEARIGFLQERQNKIIKDQAEGLQVVADKYGYTASQIIDYQDKLRGLGKTEQQVQQLTNEFAAQRIREIGANGGVYASIFGPDFSDEVQALERGGAALTTLQEQIDASTQLINDAAARGGDALDVLNGGVDDLGAGASKSAASVSSAAKQSKKDFADLLGAVADAKSKLDALTFKVADGGAEGILAESKSLLDSELSELAAKRDAILADMEANGVGAESAKAKAIASQYAEAERLVKDRYRLQEQSDLEAFNKAQLDVTLKYKRDQTKRELEQDLVYYKELAGQKGYADAALYDTELKLQLLALAEQRDAELAAAGDVAKARSYIYGTSLAAETELVSNEVTKRYELAVAAAERERALKTGLYKTTTGALGQTSEESESINAAVGGRESAELEALASDYAKGLVLKEDYEKGKADLERKYQSERYKDQVNELSVKKAILADALAADKRTGELSSEERAALQSQYIAAEKAYTTAYVAYAESRAAADKKNKITREELVGLIKSSLGDITSEVSKAAGVEADAERAKYDTLISLQQNRVEAAKRIAEKGSGAQLAAEEKRLEYLLKAKAKAAQRERAINATIAASTYLIAVAEGALAISKAVKASAGEPIQTAIRVGTIISSLLAGGLAVVAQFRAIRQESAAAEFYKGGYTGDGGKHEVKGVVHGGEFVFTKERTAQFRQVFEQIHLYGKLPVQSPLVYFSSPLLNNSQNGLNSGAYTTQATERFGAIEANVKVIAGYMRRNSAHKRKGAVINIFDKLNKYSYGQI